MRKVLSILPAIFVLAIVASISDFAFAVPLRHSLASLDNIDSWQSQRQCYKVLSKNRRLYCLPVGTLRVESGQIVFDGSFNSNEEAYTILSRFLDKDIDRPFLEGLFDDSNFQTFSGLVRFSAIYGETTFALVPYHIAAGFKVGNPSLPEVNFAAVTSSHLMISHNFLVDGVGAYSLLLAPTVTIGSKESKVGDFDVLELAAKKTEDVIRSERWTERAGSFSVGVISRRAFFPSLTIRGNNLVASKGCNYCRVSHITIDDEVAPYTIATLGSYIPLDFGLLWLGVDGKYGGIEPKFNQYGSNALALYRLGYLDSFLSFSPAMVSFGFVFDSELYRVGIQYTDEKQSNELQIARKKYSYIHLGFKI